MFASMDVVLGVQPTKAFRMDILTMRVGTYKWSKTLESSLQFETMTTPLKCQTPIWMDGWDVFYGKFME